MDNLAPPTPFDTSLIGFGLALVALVAFYAVRNREERGWIFRLALISFLIKAILVPIYFFWLVSLGDYGFAYFDARGHHEEGINIAIEKEYGVTPTTWGNFARDPGMYLITAYTYMIFGPNTLIIRFFLIAAISMSLLYIYRITKSYTDEKTARVAALLQAFLPFPIVTSLNHRKDPLVQLIVLFMFYHAIRVFRQDDGWPRSALFTLVGLAAVYPFRSGLILPFIGVMVICFVLANRNPLQGIVLTIATVLSLVILQLSVEEDSKIGLETYTDRVERTLVGSAALSQYGGIASLLRMRSALDVYKLPFAAGAYLILPFPPETEGYPVSILSSWLNVIGILFLPHMLVGAWSLIRGPNWRMQLPLLVFPVVFLFVLGAVHIGVIRYKLIFYPVCLIWAAVGWQVGTSFFLRFLIYGVLLVATIPVYMNRFGLL